MILTIPTTLRISHITYDPAKIGNSRRAKTIGSRISNDQGAAANICYRWCLFFDFLDVFIGGCTGGPVEDISVMKGSEIK